MVLVQIIIETIMVFSNVLIFLIVVRAILSWFPEPRDDGPLRSIYIWLLRIAHTMTEPIVGPIRKLIQRSPLGGPGMILDFSPIIAFFLIRFARDILISLVNSILL